MLLCDSFVLRIVSRHASFPISDNSPRDEKQLSDTKLQILLFCFKIVSIPFLVFLHLPLTFCYRIQSLHPPKREGAPRPLPPLKAERKERKGKT